MAFRYELLAQDLEGQIANGTYLPGARLPGVKSMSRKSGVSVATVISAYQILENSGLVEARPRSGYYVRQRAQKRELSSRIPANQSPIPVTGQQMALAVTKAASDPNIVQFGAAVPHRSFLPEVAVSRSLQRVVKKHRARLTGYEMPPGAAELRSEIARRMNLLGDSVAVDDILISSGCQEALRLALRAVTQPGDIVAVESPTFYGALQILDVLRLKVIEIPTDPRAGMSPEALALALENWPVKAVLVVPNNQNPLGYTMSDARKRALAKVTQSAGITLIEDDIYGDLSYSGERPKPIRLLRPDADVIYCSSFSKTISPGLRVGWLVGGQHHDQLQYLKYVSNVATSSVAQLTLAEYLATGGYDRFLRSVRPQYHLNVVRMSELLTRKLNMDVAISQPTGGGLIWVQLPEQIDTFKLATKLLGKGISIAPGNIFSASGKYQSCLRLSCACLWDHKTESALIQLANVIQEEIK